MESKGLLSCSQEPTFGLYHDASCALSVRSILILSFDLCLGLASGLFWIPNHNTMHFCSLPYVPHAVPISPPPPSCDHPIIFFEDTNHTAAQYAVSSSLL